MSRSALLVIDLQGRYTRPDAPFALPRVEELLDGVNALAARCREAGAPVIWIAREIRPQVGPGRRTTRRYGDAVAANFTGDNAALDPRLDIRPSDVVLGKPRQSAFYGSDLDSVLRNLGVERLLLCGATTNVCVLATAQDAAARDYDVVVVSDLTASLPIAADGERLLDADEVQRAALAFVRHGLGDVADSATVEP